MTEMLLGQDRHEQEPMREVHSFVVLDLDRTILNTDALNRQICERIDKSIDTSPEQGDPYEFIQSQKGKALSVAAYLDNRYGHEAYEQVTTTLAREAETPDQPRAADLIYPGVAELLAALEDNDTPYGILTYGEPANQIFKLRIFHALVKKYEGAINALVTDQQFKAQWIESNWKESPDSEGGWFVVHPELSSNATIKAQHIVVVDDKLENTQSEDARIVEFVVDNDQSNPEADFQPIEQLAHLIQDGKFIAWVDKKVEQKA